MALIINNDDCTSCDACPEACPNEAISVQDSKYIIDPEKCTECVGAHDEPQCVSVCPADCIIPDPNVRETKEQLEEKYRKLHG